MIFHHQLLIQFALEYSTQYLNAYSPAVSTHLYLYIKLKYLSGTCNIDKKGNNRRLLHLLRTIDDDIFVRRGKTLSRGHPQGLYHRRTYNTQHVRRDAGLF